MLDGKQPGLLLVPQLQAIENFQIALPHAPQGLPALGFQKIGKLAPLPLDRGEVEPVGRQLGVQPREHPRQGQPTGQIVGRRRRRHQPLDFTLRRFFDRLDPGQLLRKGSASGFLTS